MCFVSNRFLFLFFYPFSDVPGPSPNRGAANHDGGPKTPVPRFLPERSPGLNLPECQTRQDLQKYLRPIDFFCLFFTVDIVQQMCDWTNEYAESVGEHRKSLYTRWTKVDVDEFYRFIGHNILSKILLSISM